MNNIVNSMSFLFDAEIILEESRFSLERGHWHRVVRKSQEATELAIKGLFKYLGLDYPKSHILGKVIKKELAKHRLFDKEELNKIAFISDSLSFDREPSFYPVRNLTPLLPPGQRPYGPAAAAGLDFRIITPACR